MANNVAAAALRHSRLAVATKQPTMMQSIIAKNLMDNTITIPFQRRLLSTALFRSKSFYDRSHATLVQQRNFWSSTGSLPSPSYSHLAHMEQTANKMPQSASAQNAFYSALLRANRPELVVQRYESGKFASNPSVQALYMKAVDQLNPTIAGSAGSSATPVDAKSGGAVLGQLSQLKNGNNQGPGTKMEPVHVVLAESKGTFLFRWLRFLTATLFASWFIYFVAVWVITGASSEGSGMLRKIGGSSPQIKPEKVSTRFSDVHGCPEAKEELQEVVDFLKSPEKYSTLGGKMPKGILLVGPPGTGKTLLARAVAGEAGVSFFYMSGSEFDEVYVGVGAKRIRDLFSGARKNSPAIIFIDELDAIGGRRNERDPAHAKQTLNQLLTELDGFQQSSGVIILAATNFPQLLDNALTRPGRFDRQVVVDMPDVRGRIAILTHYLKKMNIDKKVDVSVIGRGTPGFSGADLENLVNSAAVHASKRQAKAVEMFDFEWAKDKILMGAEKRSQVIPEHEKIQTAYHEGGHTLVALYTPYATPLYKATIMPRGMSLGTTHFLPEMDKYSTAKREFEAQMDVAMGGKVAEEMIYGIEGASGGASSDISKATNIAYTMVTRLGMSNKLGSVDLHSDYERLPSETKQVIWDEVRRLVDASKARATVLLTQRRKELDLLAKALLEYETLGREEIELVVKGKKLPDTFKSLAGAPIKLPDGPLQIDGPNPPLPPGGMVAPNPTNEPPGSQPVS